MELGGRMDMLKKIKDVKTSISFARNSYNALTGIVVVAIVLILNLALQQIVGTSLNIDISSDNLYEISDITTELLDGLESEVEFIVLADKSSTDELIVNFIEKYSNLSNKIAVEWIDPILYPTALETYDTGQDTMVVSCADTGKSTTISLGDIYYFDEMSYYYYGTYTYYFDGDGQLTSAINQVTNTTENKMYTVSGHGEGSIASEVTELLEKSSVTTEELNLLTTTEIPEDCDLLAMVTPLSDLTEDEVGVLSDYLEAGGDILLMLGDTTESMPNLEALLLEYGLEVADGYIADLERSYQGNGYYIIPNLVVSGDMATDIKTESVLIVNTRGFVEVDPARDTISVSAFMTTSDYGISVTEDAEIEGTYALGAVATESTTADDGTTVDSRFTVYGSANIIATEVTEAFTSLENTTLFINSVMANFENSTNVSIDEKVIEDTYNMVDDPNTLSVIFIGIIPLSILVAGFIVWNKRRKQ